MKKNANRTSKGGPKKVLSGEKRKIKLEIGRNPGFILA